MRLNEGNESDDVSSVGFRLSELALRMWLTSASIHGVRYNESGRKKNDIIRNLFEVSNKIIRRHRKDKNEIE